MDLESCFDIVSDSDIRIRGTRIGIETVLCDFLEGASPEEIAVRYRSLKLADVYATITFYYHDRARVEDYLAVCGRADDAAGKQQAERPDDLIEKAQK